MNTNYKPTFWEGWKWITDKNGIGCWELDISDKVATILNRWDGGEYGDPLEATATVRKYRKTYNVAWETEIATNEWDECPVFTDYHMKKYSYEDFDCLYGMAIYTVAESIWQAEYACIGIEKKVA